jgi:hypothetical protein
MKTSNLSKNPFNNSKLCNSNNNNNKELCNNIMKIKNHLKAHSEVVKQTVPSKTTNKINPKQD